MSRLNKVNPDHYTMAGRLSADDLARERMRQGPHRPERGRARNKPLPPWLAKEAANDRGAAEDTGSDRVEVTAPKRARPAPRRKVTGEAPATARRQSTKASGARGTPKTRKAPAARAKATGVTRRTPKKKRS
jgi:hypothetical protein